MDIITGVAGNSISNIVIAPIIQLMNDVIHKNEYSKLLEADLNRMKILLDDITILFQHQQREPPESINNWLKILWKLLTEAERLLDRSEPRQWCLECLMCKPVRLSRQITGWNEIFDKLYQEFERSFSLLASAGQIVSSAPQQGEALLQDLPACGFEGSGIKDAQTQVETWLREDDQVQLIGVYGMAGVGKTSLLKMVYNNFKVSNVFHDVIWVTVSRNYEILNLQGDIAKEINLNLPSNSSINMQKRKLSNYMKGEKFLVVLDDLWSRLDLQELGVAFGHNKDSKVLFSTRNKDLIQTMRAEKSIEIQPLSKHEAWMLFARTAFKEARDVSVEIEACAKEIADECKGLPLAINVVSAAMNSKTSVDEWKTSLSLMKSSDPSFPLTHPTVDQELYQRLRWSYDALPHSNMKICFLYSAMFPKGEVIDADDLVRMWISERLFKSRLENHSMDMAIGRKYVKLLVDRCLFENVKIKKKKVGTDYCIRVHDVIRDMAVHIGENEENFLFMGGQNLQKFPQIQDEDVKRMSLVSNSVGYLPIEFRCQKLVSLRLGSNPLQHVPSEFLINLISLKVLDLSNCTILYSIPSYLGQLTMLEFLTLSRLPIRKLPEEICHLSRLQFLNLSSCEHLDSLPDEIGELKNLSYLNLSGCSSLVMIPRGFSELTQLSILYLWSIHGLSVEASAPTSIHSLKGFKNLTQLAVKIIMKPGRKLRIKEGIMGTWSEMKRLWLSYDPLVYNPLLHNLMEELPMDMQDMNKLQSLYMEYCHGTSLPNSICNFQHLEEVTLYYCAHLRELSTLESLPNLKFLKLSFLSHLKELGIGSSSRPSGFQKLEKLVLEELPLLKSMAGSSHNELWNEQTLPKLHILKIYYCPKLKRFPTGMEKLLNLDLIVGNMNWWETLIWEDNDIKLCLERLFKERKSR